MDFDLLSMKQRAKMIMKGAVPNIFVISLIFIGLTSGIHICEGFALRQNVTLFFIVYIFGTVLTELCVIGYVFGILKISREKEGKLTDLFCAFSENPMRNILVVFVKIVVLWIGYALCVIPGIILFYRLRFVYYELLEENKSVRKAFADSMSLMKGHCMELFKIDLFFIGWHILNIVTLGIAGIYVKPLITITYAEYYDYLKGQKEIFSMR